MGVTAELCDKIVANSLTPESVRKARRLVLDGIAVAGSRKTAIGILADHYRSLGGTPDAAVLGLGFRTSATAAAALNGASMHVLDFEPMWNPANHALSATLPAVLALADRRKITGRDLVTALVKGIELAGWIRHAGHDGAIRFHPPGMVGPMGAAVAAGHVLGLDAGQLAHALGLAASRAGGLTANAGTMTKLTHCGQGVMLGLEAAMLAARGFTANPEPFEAHQGYVHAFFTPDFQVRDLLNFGPPFRVVDPGCVIKLYPSQFATQFVISAGLELHRRCQADPRRAPDCAADAVHQPAAAKHRARGKIQCTIHARRGAGARSGEYRYVYRRGRARAGNRRDAGQDLGRDGAEHSGALRPDAR